MKTILLAGMAVATMLAAGAATAGEPETYAFQFSLGKTTCTVDYPRSDDTTLSFLYRPSDGLFNVKVTRPRWEMVDNQNLDAEDMPVTLDFKDVGKTSAAWGGYQDGYVQGVWSSWDAKASGAGSTTEAMALLQKGQVVTVIFKGETLGTFDMKQKGLAFNLLKGCQPTG